jgi:shikimate kinase
VIDIGSKHIILVGMMGTGKTAVGRRLAMRMGRPFYDTDQLIEEREGCSVAELFDAKGEAYFRDVECDVVREAVGRPPAVIATGGGVLQRRENRDRLHGRGVVIWLAADLDELARRTAKRPQTRPLLKGQEPKVNLERLLADRERFYGEAEFSVDTTGKRVHDVASMILNRLRGGRAGRQEDR